MRRPLIAGNWKMNMTPSEADAFAKSLVSASYNENVEKLICVPAIDLVGVVQLVKSAGIEVGAQNMYFEEKGAFTGEISPNMLTDIGVGYVILGHSERREIFHEDDELIRKKVKAALDHNLTPILCCGESLVEREDDKAYEKIERQIKKNLEGLETSDVKKVVIAYEPIWAIGTGKTASSDDAEDMTKYIRQLIEKDFGKEVSEEIRILYGGSVKPANISELMAKENIDGALVGGASLDVMSFTALVNY